MNYVSFLSTIKAWGEEQMGKPGNFKVGDHFVAYSYTTDAATRTAKNQILQINTTTGKFAVKGVKVSDAGNELFLRLSPYDPRNPIFDVLGQPQFKAQLIDGTLKIG